MRKFWPCRVRESHSSLQFQGISVSASKKSHRSNDKEIKAKECLPSFTVTVTVLRLSNEKRFVHNRMKAT